MGHLNTFNPLTSFPEKKKPHHSICTYRKRHHWNQMRRKGSNDTRMKIYFWDSRSILATFFFFFFFILHQANLLKDVILRQFVINFWWFGTQMSTVYGYDLQFRLPPNTVMTHKLIFHWDDLASPREQTTATSLLCRHLWSERVLQQLKIY